jgi:hypothetical protein
MGSFISTFITVGICLAIYAYIKRKYSKEIQELESQIADLNLQAIKANTRIRELDTVMFMKDRELSAFKSKLDAAAEINKELTVTKKANTSATEAPKKRGRKPGYKKPFYKKKSGGNPS